MKASVLTPEESRKLSFQDRVHHWMQTTFSREKVESPNERVNRMFEEAVELAQAMGLSEEGAHAMVRHKYNMPVGEVPQEIAGLEIALYALANSLGYEVRALRDKELDRCWNKIDKIRQKNLDKPSFT